MSSPLDVHMRLMAMLPVRTVVAKEMRRREAPPPEKLTGAKLRARIAELDAQGKDRDQIAAATETSTENVRYHLRCLKGLPR